MEMSKEESLLVEDSFDVINIKKIVSDMFHLNDDKLESADRHRDIAIPRHLAIFFIKQNSTFSLKRIGAFFGNRDHSTVLHSLTAVEDMFYTKDSYIQKKYKQLINNYSNYKLSAAQDFNLIYDFSIGWLDIIDKRQSVFTSEIN